jgi:hypothetical protein
MNTYSIKQISLLYRYGVKYDFQRRGHDVKGFGEQESWEDIRKDYYTEAELKELEKYK